MNIRFNNRRLNLILGLLVLVLSVIIVLSVQNPLSKGKEIERREKAVIERLNLIRNAELRYRQVNGQFCGSIDSLVMTGFIPDSIQYVPFSNGKRFFIKAVVIADKGGKRDYMECSTTYDDYLFGLDESTISEAKRQAIGRGDFPGLRFGDINNQSDNIGNWE
ncbi:MAG: hypothetical protein ACI4B3_09950 [Prevotella sp.]